MTSTPDSASWITGKSVLTPFHPVWDLSDTVSAISASILKQRGTVTSDLSILALFILKPRPNSGPKPGEHSCRAFSWEIMFTRTGQTKNQEKKSPFCRRGGLKKSNWVEGKKKQKNKGNRRSRNREKRQRRFVFYVTRLLLPTRHQEQNYVVASSELTWRL